MGRLDLLVWCDVPLEFTPSLDTYHDVRISFYSPFQSLEILTPHQNFVRQNASRLITNEITKLIRSNKPHEGPSTILLELGTRVDQPSAGAGLSTSAIFSNRVLHEASLALPLTIDTCTHNTTMITEKYAMTSVDISFPISSGKDHRIELGLPNQMSLSRVSPHLNKLPWKNTTERSARDL